MGDFEWSDMPEELAAYLYTAVTAESPVIIEAAYGSAGDWLCSNIKTCASGPFRAEHAADSRCGELPVPGSEFCPVHMPPEEMGDND